MISIRKKRRLGPFFMTGILICFFLPMGVSFAGFRPPSPQDVSDFETRLKKIGEQIKDIRAKIAAESKRETSILSTLSRIDLNKSLIRKEIAARNIQMSKTSSELEALQAEIGLYKDELKEEEDAIRTTLVTLYKFGRADFLQFLLQAKDLETYLTESRHLSLLAQYQDETISGYLQTLDDLRTAETNLEGKKTELEEIIREEKAKQEELLGEEKRNAALIRRVRRNKADFEQSLQELNQSTEQLQVMIERVINQEWVLPSTFIPLDEKKGALSWPVEGRIITSFGYQRHPQFNTIIRNNGIEIVPRQDESLIHAIHSGKIAYADYQDGYGNLLIIDHGMSFYTLYAHCEEFLVEMGEMVEESQPIALVGDSGSFNGECLYFEIRHKTEPLNPLQWLKRR